MIRKIRLLSNLMMSQPHYQVIVIYILSNISRSKDNQAMKYGQLIEYNMRNFFLENHTQNVVEKLVQTLFWKSKIEHISGSIV